MARARAAGLHVVPTGLAHGTVTIIADGLPIEITTLREDIETDGRHAKVRVRPRFSRRRAAARFHHQRALARSRRAASTTMPAASPISRRGACASSAMRDSASARTILRILRFFRFSARFGEGELDAEGFAAAIAERDGPRDSLARARARGTVETARRAARRRRSSQRPARRGCSGRFAGVADPARLRRLDRARSGARRAARPAAAARGAGGARSRRTPSACANGCGSRTPNSSASRAWRGRLAGAARRDAPPSLGDLRMLLFERGRQGATRRHHARPTPSAGRARTIRALSRLSLRQRHPASRACRSAAPTSSRAGSVPAARRRGAEEPAGAMDPRGLSARAGGAGAADGGGDGGDGWILRDRRKWKRAEAVTDYGVTQSGAVIRDIRHSRSR